MHIAAKRVFRLSLTVALSLAVAYGTAQTMPFIAPLFALMLGAEPKPPMGPKGLLGLLLLPAIGWWSRVDARRSNPWQGNVDAHLLPHLLEGGGEQARRAWSRWLGLLAAAVALLAMAGPSWQKDEQPLWQTRAPLVA